MQEETPEFVLNKFRHDINCLSDNSRAIRKNGLDKLSKELFQIKNKEILQQLLSQYLMNPLVKCLEDPIEKHREATINIYQKLLNEVKFDNVLVAILLSAVIGRMGQNPFPETSEECRLKLINLLGILLDKYTSEFKPSISALSKMIEVLLKDPCPDIKVKLSEFIIVLTDKMKQDLGAHAKGIISSLCLNLKHQHNKIRKITTTTLVDVLLCDNAGSLYDDCVLYLKPIANDKNSDVRKNFYLSVAKLLENLNIIYLRRSEPSLVMLLLNGLGDEKEDIQKQTADLIEEVGNNRKKLAIEIGEDISEFI